ncbi:MAG: amino acid ABC transporter ATP-binding protein [Bdellovibrionaceae bacterium]|nr:amino acid ABC transporter ATP-binding protein [Pseudobdellovibrionaceae bacterium]
MKIQKLNCLVGSRFALSDISFEAHPGQLLSIVGRSGSGKSTFLRCLAGLEVYTVSHEVKSPKMGFVFQSSNLFPHLNLVQNIQLALKKVQKKTDREIAIIVDEVLTKVRLQHCRQHYPQNMSGGEQQRGAIARALALKPDVMLYDEPTSALDPELVDEVYDIMLDLKKTNIIQIVVTHDRRALKRISDQVGYIDQGNLKMLCSLQQMEQQLKKLTPDQQKYLELYV